MCKSLTAKSCYGVNWFSGNLEEKVLLIRVYGNMTLKQCLFFYSIKLLETNTYCMHVCGNLKTVEIYFI